MIAAIGGFELVFERMLHAHVERQADRRAIGQGSAVNSFDTDGLVDVFFNPRRALVVEIDRAQDVSGKFSGRIGAAQLFAE